MIERDNIEPPPELIMEINVTKTLINKLALFAVIGVPELLRHDRKTLTLHVHVESGYIAREENSLLPGVKRAAIAQFVEAGTSANRPAWLREIRGWAQAQTFCNV